MIHLLSFFVHIASAHEVYVLNSNQVTQALDTPSFNLFAVAFDNLDDFIFWAFIGLLTVFCVFWISTLRFLERKLDPTLLRIRKYATHIARVTIGLSFLAGAYYQAIFGPELPLAGNFDGWSGIVTGALIVMGLLFVTGYYVRVASVIGVLLYGAVAFIHGSYLLTYINYLGDFILLLILGSGEGKKIIINTKWLRHIHEYLAPRSFAILRVLFGIALIYASAYAKIIHNNLALMTVQQYHLDKLLGFEPHFLVLGAAIVEFLIGLFFVLGIEIRFTAFFMLFWLTLSLIFFGEAVWPHLILIGIPIAYLFYGYDRYSLEGYFFRKKKYEPVL